MLSFKEFDFTMHRHFMLEALNQAWLGRGNCAPNPSVGAIAVSGDDILAKAYHQGVGKPHAERMVLQQLSGISEGITLYVTLEPCNHWGRTPPCVEAIIHAGVSRVVYAYSDPNPLVATNNTPSLLSAKGIEVIHYPMPEIDSFYQSYQHWLLKQKPWVTVKLAQSLDGKIAGEHGQPLQLSNQECSKFTHEHRLHSDIILTTANTILQDNPRMDVRLPDIRQNKTIAIIDSRLRLTEKAGIFSTAAHCHIYHDARYPIINPIANVQYHAVAGNDDGLDLAFIIHHLGQLGCHDLWVEAGGRLFSALHTMGLVDRTFLYIVPKVLGETAVNGYHGDLVFKRKHHLSWEAKSDNMLLCLDWLEDRCLPD